MTTVAALKSQDSALRKQFADDPDAVKTAQIHVLMGRVQEAGRTTSGIAEREQLIGILQYWAPLVEEKTGEESDFRLAAFDPEADIETPALAPEPETAVSPVINDTKPTGTVTYTPGQPEENSPQTLAQLFMTMPTFAKAAILITIALILAAAIYWILSPKSEQPAADVPATETAVVAAITASAQPTGTATPTATPVIYIQSETAVAQAAAPVGSPTPIIYVVQTGDTLNKIAQKYGIPVQDIATLNNIYNANSIAVGQELLIPTPAPGTIVPTVAPASTNPPQATPAPAQAEATVAAVPQTSTGAASELVIRSTEPVELRIAAGPDYQAITTLPQGTFATIIAKTPDGVWYLIQLEDGYTRGWVPSESTALLSPADPNNIPTTPAP